jgi:pimeloyl-ACP methyl ester carboxylesterase
MGASGPDERPLDEAELLSYDELNVGADNTILLIHGAFSTGAEEWNKVTPYLSGYHLILPDLYSRRKLLPSSSSSLLKSSTQQLAALIEKKAVRGKAHIVCFSLGAHVAIQLIAIYPNIIDTAFITGYNVFPNTNPTLMAYMFWLGGQIEGAFAKCLGRQSLGSHTTTLDEYREVTNIVCFETWPPSWPARTLTIAAGKAGLFADHVKDAIKLQDIGRQSNLDTAAYTHQDLVHAWHAKKPEMFAQTCNAWFKAGKVIGGFKKL